jgi:hypothetical protein
LGGRRRSWAHEHIEGIHWDANAVILEDIYGRLFVARTLV